MRSPHGLALCHALTCRYLVSKNSNPSLAPLAATWCRRWVAAAGGDGVRGVLTRVSDPSALFAEAKAAWKMASARRMPPPQKGNQGQWSGKGRDPDGNQGTSGASAEGPSWVLLVRHTARSPRSSCSRLRRRGETLVSFLQACLWGFSWKASSGLPTRRAW